MEQNQFIENILNSTNGIAKVTPNDDLFSKIQKRINEENNVSVSLLFKIAASIVILITINLFLITRFEKNENIEETTALENSISTNNNIY